MLPGIYCPAAEADRKRQRERQEEKMNAEMRFNRGEFIIDEKKTIRKQENDMDEMKRLGVVSEKCNCSVYSMATVASGVLLAIGTIIYSLFTL